MKNIRFLGFFLLLCCCTSCEGLADILRVYNNSDEAIYVYFKYGSVDSLPLEPELVLFDFFDSHFASPDYRINAYNYGTLHGELTGKVWGNPPPRLPKGVENATLFFITEKTMRSYDWATIHKDQIYAKKTILTEEELRKINWTVEYK